MKVHEGVGRAVVVRVGMGDDHMRDRAVVRCPQHLLHMGLIGQAGIDDDIAFGSDDHLCVRRRTSLEDNVMDAHRPGQVVTEVLEVARFQSAVRARPGGDVIR